MKAGMVSVADLHPHPSNVRADLGDLTELAASIQSLGLLQPLVVKPRPAGGWTVVDGHRRLGGLKLTTIDRALCLIRDPSDGAGDLAIMLASAMHQQLTPIEQADGFRALRNQGMTPAQIARATGYTTRMIGARLILLDLPVEARNMLADGRLNLSDAQDLCRQLIATPSGAVTKAHPSGPRSASKPTWLSKTHPLAAAVAQACDHSGTRARIGGVGCGQCWEQAIRNDAIAADVRAAA